MNIKEYENEYTMIETRLMRVVGEDASEAQLDGRFIKGFKNNMVTADLVREVMDNADIKVGTLNKNTTLVQCTLPNDYTIIETSSCLDEANYDEAIGAEVCLRKIECKVWQLLGFLYATARNGFKAKKNSLVEQALDLAFDEILKEELGDIERLRGTKFYQNQKQNMFDSLSEELLASLNFTAETEELSLEDMVELIVALYLATR